MSSSSNSKNTETFIACESEYAEADICIFGAPFDGTVSYRPGARFAPKSIRSESFGIETYSPYQDKDLTSLRIFDCGDLELPFGNAARAVEMIRGYTAGLLNDGKLPVMTGGEHLVTLGAARAAYEKYPELHLIHFDAHTDLRDEYLGEKLSHACVIRRIWDFLGDGRIYQFGIRSGEGYEFNFAAEHTYMQKFNLGGLDEAITALAGKPVYITIDLDVLDPSAFPGTGTPEGGGVTFNELLCAIVSFSRLNNIVGCDITELSPPYDPSGISTAAACKILRELLLSVSNKLFS